MINKEPFKERTNDINERAQSGSQSAADQFTLDRTLKHLRKLRWIGKEREAQRILWALGDKRLRPSLSGDERLAKSLRPESFREALPS